MEWPFLVVEWQCFNSGGTGIFSTGVILFGCRVAIFSHGVVMFGRGGGHVLSWHGPGVAGYL